MAPAAATSHRGMKSAPKDGRVAKNVAIEVSGRPEAQKASCQFCHKSDLKGQNDIEKAGRMFKFVGKYYHFFCVFFSENICQSANERRGLKGFEMSEIMKAWRAGQSTICFYCSKNGATMRCKKCKRKFHYTCGQKHDAVFIYHKTIGVYCSSHRPKQSIKVKVNDKVCVAGCYEQIKPADVKVMISPCCGRRYHLECVQNMALSCGSHHFKCPMCSDKDNFAKVAMSLGTYVPVQDAAWEQEEDFYGFNAQGQLYDMCDAKKCLCPKGRKHTLNGSYFELIRCENCGGGAVHIKCGQLLKKAPYYLCNKHDGAQEQMDRHKVEIKNNPDYESSDSDGESEAAVAAEEMAAEDDDNDKKAAIEGDRKAAAEAAALAEGAAWSRAQKKESKKKNKAANKRRTKLTARKSTSRQPEQPEQQPDQPEQQQVEEIIMLSSSDEDDDVEVDVVKGSDQSENELELAAEKVWEGGDSGDDEIESLLKANQRLKALTKSNKEKADKRLTTSEDDIQEISKSNEESQSGENFRENATSKPGVSLLHPTKRHKVALQPTIDEEQFLHTKNKTNNVSRKTSPPPSRRNPAPTSSNNLAHYNSHLQASHGATYSLPQHPVPVLNGLLNPHQPASVVTPPSYGEMTPFNQQPILQFAQPNGDVTTIDDDDDDEPQLPTIGAAFSLSSMPVASSSNVVTSHNNANGEMVIVMTERDQDGAPMLKPSPQKVGSYSSDVIGIEPPPPDDDDDDDIIVLD